jgi:TRAP-type C4-dicarboxylate transport system substrate-binding protein
MVDLGGVSVPALMSRLPGWGSVTGMNRTMRMPLAAALAAALLGLAACGSQAAIDKAGAARHHVTVIRLQMPDGGDPDGLYFAQDVARRSHGMLKVVVDSSSYPSSLAANEAKLAAALRAGLVGFSYQPARDWATAGVPGFQALHAPFLVTTVQASERLAASPVAGALLRELSPLGLVGIGLIPNEPRQLLSTRPLITPSAFSGIKVRIVDSPKTATLVRAIGGRPVQGVTSRQVGAMLRSGSVAGVETSPRYVLSNSYNAEASYLTAYALFPKFETIVASARSWRALTAAQRAAIRRAAADTLAHARQVPAREKQELSGLCAGGLVLDAPPPAQLAALVRETVGAAPAGASAAAMTRTIRAVVPGTGPQPSPVPLPPQCRSAGTAAQAIALHRLAVPGGPGQARGASVPPGTYVTTDSVADFRAGGVYGADWNKPIIWTIHLHPNGTVYQTQQPDYPDQPFGRGRYVVKGDEATFIWAPIDELTPETVRWSYFGGQLTFAIVHVQDTASRIVYTAHPWRKVS